MNMRRLIGRFLAVLVIAGLIAAPVAAKGPSGIGMSDTMSMSGESMSGEMPCCPDTQKDINCRDCPIVAMCISTFMQAAPAMEAAILIRQPIRVMLFAFDDTVADGLDRPPPDHPPRSLV